MTAIRNGYPNITSDLPPELAEESPNKQDILHEPKPVKVTLPSNLNDVKIIAPLRNEIEHSQHHIDENERDPDLLIRSHDPEHVCDSMR